MRDVNLCSGSSQLDLNRCSVSEARLARPFVEMTSEGNCIAEKEFYITSSTECIPQNGRDELRDTFPCCKLQVHGLDFIYQNYARRLLLTL